MKSKIGDKEVLQLLTKIKMSDSHYPQDMIESRRDMFTKQAAAMAVLMKAGLNGTNGTGASQTATSATTTSSSTATGIGGMSAGKLLETLLVIAIVAEAGVATYVYREKITEFFSSTFGPKVEQVSNPENNSSDTIANNEISITETVSSETPEGTATATETPLPPGYTPSAAQADNNGNDAGNPQVEATPEPDNGNGLHLGQTKQPSKEPEKNEAKDTKVPKENKND